MSVLLYLLGLVGFVAVFVAISWVMGYIVGAEGRGDSRWRAFTLTFTPTVLPIATAYELAHNYAYVLRNLALFVAQLETAATGAVTGMGTAAEPVALLGRLPVGAFWGSQVLLIVAGHVIAVVAAHRVALAVGETASDARRIHAPLVALMVGYTVLSYG